MRETQDSCVGIDAKSNDHEDEDDADRMNNAKNDSPTVIVRKKIVSLTGRSIEN